MAEEENTGQDPSMEDILASIRRILSDDGEEGGDAAAAAPEPAPTPETEPEAETELAEEDEMDMAVALEEIVALEPEPKLEPEIEMEDMIEESEPEAEPEPIPASPPPPQPADAVEDILELTERMIAQPMTDPGAGAPILSTAAHQTSTDALQGLARALLSKRDIAIVSRDMTLEGLIREILRPILREWLDQNLPYLIERLVKKEIDHMVNKAESLDL